MTKEKSGMHPSIPQKIMPRTRRGMSLLFILTHQTVPPAALFQVFLWFIHYGRDRIVRSCAGDRMILMRGGDGVFFPLSRYPIFMNGRDKIGLFAPVGRCRFIRARPTAPIPPIPILALRAIFTAGFFVF